MARESLFNRRQRRVRFALKSRAKGKVRLTVCRSNAQIYAQLIDDAKGITLASASSLDKGLKLKNGGNVEAAIAVGKLIAERGVKKNVKEVVFDRGGHIYHGRLKALADAAREAGLVF